MPIPLFPVVTLPRKCLLHARVDSLEEPIVSLLPFQQACYIVYSCYFLFFNISKTSLHSSSSSHLLSPTTLPTAVNTTTAEEEKVKLHVHSYWELKYCFDFFAEWVQLETVVRRRRWFDIYSWLLVSELSMACMYRTCARPCCICLPDRCTRKM